MQHYRLQTHLFTDTEHTLEAFDDGTGEWIAFGTVVEKWIHHYYDEHANKIAYPEGVRFFEYRPYNGTWSRYGLDGNLKSLDEAANHIFCTFINPELQRRAIQAAPKPQDQTLSMF